ncbi:MAG: carboxylate-amine ligase [Alphaproteobacteria bacterium]|nr:carboxylate-amine ligase [Alphaproteobacteria bacterium]MCW5742288.1 carboxylate-amine ligase [Alphaproteobacteria bacterium]
MTEAYTFGIEEEYFLIRRDSLAPVRRMPRPFFAACRAALGERVTVELLQSQIEVMTPVCRTPDEALAHLSASRAAIDAAGRRFGLSILAAGTNPLGEWREQVPTDKRRYAALGRDLGMLAQRNMLCGMHVHVQLPNADRRVDVMTRLIPYLPQLLALSTSSPFWNRQRSGLKGYRLAAYDELPRTGLPPAFASQAHYDTYIAALVGAGVIPDSSFTWWGARPSLKHPTLELRIADCCTSVGDGVAIASLYRALAKRIVERPGPPVAVDATRYALIEENKWRAQRYGLDCEMIDPFTLEPIDARTVIARLVEEVMPEAEILDCAASVRSTLGILSRGTSADRQLDIYQGARHDAPRAESLRAVVRWLVAATIDTPERAALHHDAEAVPA